MSAFAAVLVGQMVAATLPARRHRERPRPDRPCHRARLLHRDAEPRRRREILKLLPELGKVEMPVMLQVERQSGEAELKMARALGVDRWLVDLASAARWGRTLAAERDDRAGTDANAQKRGRITRELKAELEATLRAVLDGDHK